MSYSTILIQGPALSLKSYNAAGNCRKQRRKIVCCCPWSGSDMEKNKNIDGVAQTKSCVENTSLENLKTNAVEQNSRNIKNFGNNPPRSLSDLFRPTIAHVPPLDFISSFLPPFEHFFSSTAKGRPDRQRRLPPGPSTLHLIGLSHYVIRSLPYHYPLRELANKYGPLMHIKLGELSVIVVSSANIAKEVLKTHDLACADRPRSMAGEVLSYNYSDILRSPYGEYWREMRKICNSELLGARSVRSFERIREDEASVLIEYIRSTSGVSFNLTEKIVSSMGSTTCRAVLGKMSTDEGVVRAVLGKVSMDRDAIYSVVKKALSLAGHIYLADLFPSIEMFKFISSWDRAEMLKVRQNADKIFDYIIHEHRKNLASTGKGNGELGTEDIVDVLLRLKETGEVGISITDDNIKAVISDMVAGGSETIPATVDWAMAELMRNPSVMAKAQEEIRQASEGRKTIQESEIRALKYLKLVVKETLRLHPPNCIFPRACREEFEIDGYHIPLNAVILVNVWSIGREPHYWRNPESFIPERFEENPIDYSGTHFEYIPFGSGKRMCPAMTFSIANIEFLLAQLLYHFDWKLPPGISPHDLDMTESDGMAVSRKSGLHLIATPYDPAALGSNLGVPGEG